MAAVALCFAAGRVVERCLRYEAEETCAAVSERSAFVRGTGLADGTCWGGFGACATVRSTRESQYKYLSACGGFGKAVYDASTPKAHYESDSITIKNTDIPRYWNFQN